MVIEAVFEGMALKKEVFAELDRVCKPGAILASNTSTLNIDEIASATSRPASVIGTHFFSPANVMRLLEIVRGKATSKEVIATCMQLSKEAGQGRRAGGQLPRFRRQSHVRSLRPRSAFLVEEGASVEAVDQALYDFGMAMGPLATATWPDSTSAGASAKNIGTWKSPACGSRSRTIVCARWAASARRPAQAGTSTTRTRSAIADPEVAALTKNGRPKPASHSASSAAEEIVDRCIYALVNEGARILEEGFALRAVDIDIIYLNGYGFPAYRGGPMWYADTVGLKKVYDRICEFHVRTANSGSLLRC